MINLYKLIIYSGVLAFLCMVIAVTAITTGLDFRIHKYAGMLAFFFACIHVILIIYKNIKIKASKKAAKKGANS